MVFYLATSFFSVSGLDPGFISPLENITVAAGRSTQFTCVVKHLGGHKVKFILILTNECIKVNLIILE